MLINNNRLFTVSPSGRRNSHNVPLSYTCRIWLLSPARRGIHSHRTNCQRRIPFRSCSNCPPNVFLPSRKPRPCFAPEPNRTSNKCDIFRLRLPNPYFRPTTQCRRCRPPRSSRLRNRLHHYPLDRKTSPSPYLRELLRHMVHARLGCRAFDSGPPPTTIHLSQSLLRLPGLSPPMDYALLPRYLWLHHAVYDDGRNVPREEQSSDEHGVYEHVICITF